jgi:nucleotide-binding universal stress UspA family protein
VIDEQMRSLAADHERAYLRRAAARVTSPVLDPIVARLDGPVAPALADYSRKVEADLLVLTTHGRSGFTQLWLGSVAEALLRTLSLPLLLLRPTPIRSATPPFRHILVPLDGSALAEEILPPVTSLAASEGADLTLLRIIEGGHHVAGHPREDSVAEQRATAELYLSRLAAELLSGGRSVRVAVLEAEHPARAILTAAERHGTDLIALATHGRSGLARSLLGSVADKVIRGSTLPVLALRPSPDSDLDHEGRG